ERALQGRSHCNRSQIRVRKVGQRAAEFPNRRPHRAQDVDSSIAKHRLSNVSTQVPARAEGQLNGPNASMGSEMQVRSNILLGSCTQGFPSFDSIRRI